MLQRWQAGQLLEVSYAGVNASGDVDARIRNNVTIGSNTTELVISLYVHATSQHERDQQLRSRCAVRRSCRLYCEYLDGQTLADVGQGSDIFSARDFSFCR